MLRRSPRGCRAHPGNPVGLARRAQADRTRRESERELASLSKRRDAITDQLRNVREMLSTLTGGAVATEPEPAAAEEPEAKPTDVPPQRNGDRSTARR